MPSPSFASVRFLGARARALNAVAGKPALPCLFLVTDPRRTPDPAAAAARLPRGAAVVYRAFGARDALKIGRALTRLTRRRGLLLLVGEDAALARRLGADGVHLAEASLGRARGLRRAHPRWLLTGAAHSPAALAKARGLDAGFISPVFVTRSHPGAPALGARRAAAWARTARLPVIALGGVNAKSAAILRGRFAGIAAIDGLAAIGD